MGELINEVSTGGPIVPQAGGGTSPSASDGGRGSTADPGTGSDWDFRPPAAQGGGSQADQGGPSGSDFPAGDAYESPEYGEYGPTGEVIHPDGSRSTLRHDGNWEYTDSSGQKGVWDGEGWYNEATGEPMPDGFGDPSVPTGEVTASDWQDYAGRLQDAARRADESGYSEWAERYREKYKEAVQKSTELGGQDPRPR